jgi:hypothetical protein
VCLDALPGDEHTHGQQQVHQQHGEARCEQPHGMDEQEGQCRFGEGMIVQGPLVTAGEDVAAQEHRDEEDDDQGVAQGC